MLARDRNLGPNVSLFKNYQTLLAEAKRLHLDAVVIATPNYAHAEQAIAAIAHGFPTLIEKPMVTTVDDADRVRVAAELSGALVMVGYNAPGTPPFRKLQAAMQSGQLGDLRAVSAYLCEPWIGKAMHVGWKIDPACSGGGEALDSGAHLVGSLLALVDSPAKSVSMSMQCTGATVEHGAALSIAFENDVLANLTICGASAAREARMTLMFTAGLAHLDPWGGQWIAVEPFKDDKPLPVWGLQDDPPTDVSAMFVDAIRGEAPVPADAAAGHRLAVLMDAAYQSTVERRVMLLQS